MCHFRETLGLDQMIEGEWREHGSVSVDFRFDQQCGSTYSVEVDHAVRLAGIIWKNEFDE